MDLNGKIALITGGTEGIGAACARVLRARGARVLVCGLPAGNSNGAGALYGDVTSPAFRERLVLRAAGNSGRIDILINSAGVGLYARVADTSLESARHLFEVNFFAPLAMVQLVLPYMQRQGSGAIVNIGSVGGRVALPWSPLYCASKHALDGLSDALYRELRRQRIHVMTVVPGVVKTNFRRNVLAGVTPPELERIRTMAPETLAEAIADGLERRRRFVVTPWLGHAFDFVNRWMPWIVDMYCERKFRNPAPIGKDTVLTSVD